MSLRVVGRMSHTRGGLAMLHHRPLASSPLRPLTASSTSRRRFAPTEEPQTLDMLQGNHPRLVAKEIMEVEEEDEVEESSQTVRRQVEVDNEVVGNSISEKRAFMKLVERGSGAKVKFSAVGEDRRLVTLSGGLQQVQQAEQLIRDHVRNVEKKEYQFAIIEDVKIKPSVEAGDAKIDPDLSELSVKHMQLEYSDVGRLLKWNKRVMKLLEIEKESGAKVSASPTKEVGEERLVTIQGNGEQVEKAVMMIQNVINKPMKPMEEDQVKKAETEENKLKQTLMNLKDKKDKAVGDKEVVKKPEAKEVSANKKQTVKLLQLEDEEVGILLGSREGKEKIAKKSRARIFINLRQEIGERREVRIKGSKDQVDTAVRMIQELLNQEEGETRKKLYLDEQTTALVIGPKGKNIKNTEAESGAKLNFSWSFYMREKRRTLRLAGSPEAVDKAEQIVLAQIRNFNRKEDKFVEQTDTLISNLFKEKP